MQAASAPHSPQEPRHPSLPQTLPAQAGSHVIAQSPATQ